MPGTLGGSGAKNTGGQWYWEQWEAVVLKEHWETVVLGTLGDSGAKGTLGDSGAGRQWCWEH